MEVVLSIHELCFSGGTETYLVTVGEQLQRLGHEVTVWAPVRGPFADVVRGRGLRVADEEAELPAHPDVVYAQEAETAFQLAERYPSTPMVSGLHAVDHDLTIPPQLPGLVAAVVTLYDRVERRATSLAAVSEVVRLRQPIDLSRFTPRGPLRNPPRRVLLFGSYVRGDRRELVFEACARAGLECEQVGSHTDGYTTEPEAAICDADIVIGKARAILEAMACGRAAYVYDHNGGDGWVTPERYGLLEADNFAGQAAPEVIDEDRLVRDLIGYRREMGPANRDLAVTHHSATNHAEELVALFARVARKREPVSAPLREMARLVRVQWQTDSRAIGLGHELDAIRRERDELWLQKRELEAQLADSARHAEAAERRAQAAEQRERDLRETRRFRLAAAIASPLDSMRRRQRTFGRHGVDRTHPG